MKLFVKKILRVMVNILYNPNIMNSFSGLYNYIRLCVYERKLYRIGNNCSFGKNISLHGEDCIEIGDNFRVGDYLTLQAWKEYQGIRYTPRIIIGNNVVFTNFVQISCIDQITIGDNVLLGHAVYISDNHHGKCDAENIMLSPIERKLFSKGPVKIGNNVWIGRHVSIMSGVTIGDNSIIGANSVVTKDIPENSVAVGCPAKVIKIL